jgi:hypothetical protein
MEVENSMILQRERESESRVHTLYITPDTCSPLCSSTSHVT